MAVGWRVDQEILDGLLGEGGVSLGAGRWWWMSLVLGKALSMGRNMACLAGRRWVRWRRGYGSSNRRGDRGTGMGTRRGVRRWLGWVHWRVVQSGSSLIAGFDLSNSWILQWDDFKMGSAWNDQGKCWKLVGSLVALWHHPQILSGFWRDIGQVRSGLLFDKALTQSYDDGCVMRGQFGNTSPRLCYGPQQPLRGMP